MRLAGSPDPLTITALLLAGALLLTGCVNATVTSDYEEPPCAGEAWVATQLFLGRNIPGGREVSDREWQDFVESVVAARFPQGFSVIDGTGFWKDRVTSETLQERSKVLMILHAGGNADEAALAEISAAYIERYDQQAVLRADRPSCIRFYEGAGAKP